MTVVAINPYPQTAAGQALLDAVDAYALAMAEHFVIELKPDAEPEQIRTADRTRRTARELVKARLVALEEVK